MALDSEDGSDAAVQGQKTLGIDGGEVAGNAGDSRGWIKFMSKEGCKAVLLSGTFSKASEA